jgi:hypothetical protein
MEGQSMASIIKFPRSLDSPVPRAARPWLAPKYLEGIRGKAIFSGLVEGIWVAIVLVWPVLKWVLSIDVFFQLFRMIYQWGRADVHDVWTFTLHFAVLTSLTCFVSLYQPKGNKF